MRVPGYGGPDATGIAPLESGTAHDEELLMTDQQAPVATAAGSELSVQLGDDHVAVIEIRRPPNNFFDVALIRQLADACDELADESPCRAIVLCSQGRHFCAGANFAAPASLGASDGPASLGGEDGPHLYDMALRLFQQPLPVVAAIQGAAIGGGLGLALAADFRVASPEARFSANFARLGIHHGFALTITLPAAVGQQAALDLLYTGRRVGGEEALRLGLADRLVATDVLRAQARAFAAEIAACAPLAVRSIRETIRGPLAERARDAMRRERSEQEKLMRTADWREGVAAVSERRPAYFTAR
jgi:enoyl-CoA hydratase/carnithine racemase